MRLEAARVELGDGAPAQLFELGDGQEQAVRDRDVQRGQAVRRAAESAPITLPNRIMGAKITELKPSSRAKSCVRGGASGLPNTGTY